MFKNIIGQESAKLAITDWFLHEDQPLLIYGSSGFGKTMFAESLGARTIDTTQMRGDRLGSILRPIKEAEDNEILFFDEIHSMPPSVLEGLYKIIDKGTFYDSELCMDLPLPNVRFIFATNIISPLPEAFINRCRLVELNDYSPEELAKIVQARCASITPDAIPNIIKAAKGVPRTAISMAKSIVAGAKTDGIKGRIKSGEVNNILSSRMRVDPDTGLTDKESLIVERVIERGSLSTSAVANLLHLSIKDAQRQYLEPLRASEWLAVTNRGVIPGYKAHENYRVFMKRIKAKNNSEADA